MHHRQVLMISTENLQVTRLLSHQAVCLLALSLCKVGKMTGNTWTGVTYSLGRNLQSATVVLSE